MSLRTISLLLAVSFLAACKGASAVPDLPTKVVGHCTYTNNFSKLEECKDYLGEWTEQEATDSCKGSGSSVVLTQACGIDKYLGYCIFGGNGKFERITFPGEDASKCASMKRGCEFFGGGIFDPSPICGGLDPSTGGGAGLPVFVQPTLSCVDPKPGEAPGKSEGGKVCTWQMISAATEEGRDFRDYASCDVIRSQRPYYAVGPDPRSEQADPNLSDPNYVSELNWVKTQVKAAACTCCHSTTAPEGSSNWYLEADNFLGTFHDRGIAMGAGWVDTVGFGAYPPEQNNGFTRSTPADPHHTIFPTTDDARMRRFFEAEAARRAMKKADWDGSYGAGPLDDQRFYTPKACDPSIEGMNADGTLKWLNGPARYVYVLEAGSANPTVPPNLDLPEGTLWRIDVPATGTPVKSGAVKYGQLPEGFVQKYPASGAPPQLQSGKTYYLVALFDIIQPNARCLFTAP